MASLTQQMQQACASVKQAYNNKKPGACPNNFICLKQDPYDSQKINQVSCPSEDICTEQNALEMAAVRLMCPPKGGKFTPKAAKCPQPSADRVKDSKGRNRIVYVGPKGGKYIKKDGKFVRL